MKLSVVFQSISLFKYIFKIKAGGQAFISEVIYLQFGAVLLEMQKEVTELLLKPPDVSRTTYQRTAAQSSFVRPSLVSWLLSLLIASADTMNLATQMSLSFVLLLGLIYDYSSTPLMLDYCSPCVSFPCSTIAKARLVAFSPFLCNTSFMIKGLCSLGEKKKKKKGSKLSVYLIIGQELAPVEMLAEGNAVKRSPF